MSAIFGIIDFAGRPLDPSWIKSMQNDLTHRGPDGQGLYRENSVALGHMLLHVTPESIYDKSPYEEDGFVITANARLDEREAIMNRLDIDPAERDKITDPLLLLRSFRKYGKDFVKDIYGDFSFAIWNKEKNELFCARDQMGVKPFLYYFQDNRFIFSTELKAIVRLPVVQTEIDSIYLLDQAIDIDSDPEKTAWKNIVRLRAASDLTFRDSSIIINQYWEPVYKRDLKYKTEEQCAFALRDLLERVISDHTRVLGNVGVPLSGGLDSSTIACLAARKFAKEGRSIFTASSILDPSFSEPDDKDELEYIETILRQEENTESTFIYHSNLSFLDNIDVKLNRHYATINYFHYVDEALNIQFESNSVRRVLSGFLGDMTVSNSRIYPLPHLILAGRVMAFLKLSQLIRRTMGLSLYSHIKSNILLPVLPMVFVRLLYYIRGNRTPWDIGTLPLSLSSSEVHKLQIRNSDNYRNYIRNQWDIASNIWLASIENFGEDWDCGSSFHRIEITYPLLDRRIVEFLLKVPVEYFYSDGLRRGLIRKAMVGILPEKIRKRKDKLPYSPGFHQVVRKDILIIKALLMDKKTKFYFENIIDASKLISQIENLIVTKTICTFDTDYWTFLKLSILVKFGYWIENSKVQISD